LRREMDGEDFETSASLVIEEEPLKESTSLMGAPPWLFRGKKPDHVQVQVEAEIE
jgi:hypothetical protein